MRLNRFLVVILALFLLVDIVLVFLYFQAEKNQKEQQIPQMSSQETAVDLGLKIEKEEIPDKQFERWWAEAVVAGKAYEKNGFYYLPIQILGSNQLGPNANLMLGKDKIGVSYQKKGFQPETITWTTKEVIEILPKLVPGGQIRFQFITKIFDECKEEIKKDQRCDKKCLARLEVLEKGCQRNQSLVEQPQSFDYQNEFIGPAIEIVIYE